MARQLVCDLCGKPIRGLDGDGSRLFKVKEYGANPFDCSWEKIDCHDKCVKKLLHAVEVQKEDAE